MLVWSTFENLHKQQTPWFQSANLAGGFSPTDLKNSQFGSWIPTNRSQKLHAIAPPLDWKPIFEPSQLSNWESPTSSSFRPLTFKPRSPRDFREPKHERNYPLMSRKKGLDTTNPDTTHSKPRQKNNKTSKGIWEEKNKEKRVIIRRAQKKNTMLVKYKSGRQFGVGEDKVQNSGEKKRTHGHS